MTRVSVIIPTYNRADRVCDSINSVLTQTEKNLELIVVDDGSTDNTRQVIENIPDSRVHYIWRPNGGPAAARNTGLDHAKGDFIAFLDSDDLWPENYLEIMLGKLDKNPEFGAVYSPITLVHPDGRQINSYRRPEGKEGRITADLFKNGFIWPSASLFRAANWKDFSFDEGISRSSEDSDAFLRLSVKVQFGFTAKAEPLYRVSSDSTAIREGVNENRLLSLERFYFQLGGGQFVSTKIAYAKLARTCRKLAEHYRKNKKHKAAIALYKKAMQYRPLDIRLYWGLLRSLCLCKKHDSEPDWTLHRLSDTIQTCRKKF